ncbi:hypothetical protein [Campylobacter mucosalis]|uniref:Uncharacterized protein n=1 Tax=Campylobacter mucosalis CCUG 21559 TaxID=1032067 RepID=A0A6G5QG90_9BACT|nr:hypothetical protein [Campylobacter mucosalis]QCD44116.1 hypothetical protein CMUC_0302 [Campylobacter mucosalis CCUG 21559]QCD44705.1 hypothetical protein CMUC_0916 [Campylobacter mucosalis CCUG 21559]
MGFDFSNIGSKIGEAFSGAWDWLKDTDKNGTSNALTALGTLGKVYDGYAQNKMAKKIYNVQKDAYDFNKMLSQRDMQRQNQAQQNLNTAWSNSTLSKRYNDEEEQ